MTTIDSTYDHVVSFWDYVSFFTTRSICDGLLKNIFHMNKLLLKSYFPVALSFMNVRGVIHLFVWQFLFVTSIFFQTFLNAWGSKAYSFDILFLSYPMLLNMDVKRGRKWILEFNLVSFLLHHSFRKSLWSIFCRLLFNTSGYWPCSWRYCRSCWWV